MKLTGFFSLLFLASNLLAQELPTPPQGFQWERCPEIKGAFLRPNGWYFKRELEKGTHAFFISKEEIKSGGEFKTGVTINVVPSVDKKTGKSPHQYALAFRDHLRKTIKFEKEWNNDMGPFKAVGFIFEKGDHQGAFRVHNLFITNDRTGTMYVVIFEAPSAEWDQAWKTGEPILQKMLFDDFF